MFDQQGELGQRRAPIAQIDKGGNVFDVGNVVTEFKLRSTPHYVFADATNVPDLTIYNPAIVNQPLVTVLPLNRDLVHRQLFFGWNAEDNGAIILTLQILYRIEFMLNNLSILTIPAVYTFPGSNGLQIQGDFNEGKNPMRIEEVNNAQYQGNNLHISYDRGAGVASVYLHPHSLNLSADEVRLVVETMTGTTNLAGSEQIFGFLGCKSSNRPL